MTDSSTRPTSIHGYADLQTGAHATTSDEFIHWWLPTLGPTATLLARELAAGVVDDGHHHWQCADLAVLLGLGASLAALWRALERLACFHVVVFASVDVLTVRTTMPALRPAQLARHPNAAAYPTPRTAGANR